MAGQEFGINSLGGYDANDELSLDMHLQAQPLMRWVQFCDTEENFGANHGDTLLFNKYLNVATQGGKIGENDDVPETHGPRKQSSVTISIFANSIRYTEYLMRLTKFDLKNQLHRLIINDMAKVFNTEAANTSTGFRATKVKYIPTGDSANPTGTWDVDGTVSTAATRNFSVWDVIEIIEAMKSGYYSSSNAATPVPPYDDDGNYIGMVSVGAASAIRRDPDFINASLYGDPERLFAGEIGRSNSEAVYLQ